MRDYELMVVLTTNTPDEEMPQSLERVANIITGAGGEASAPQMEPPWGRRRLAYPIEDQREGLYALYPFRLEPSQAREVDRGLKLNEDVLRFLITRTDEQPDEAPDIDDAESEPVQGEVDVERP